MISNVDGKRRIAGIYRLNLEPFYKGHKIKYLENPKRLYFIPKTHFQNKMFSVYLTFTD